MNIFEFTDDKDSNDKEYQIQNTCISKYNLCLKDLEKDSYVVVLKKNVIYQRTKQNKR